MARHRKECIPRHRALPSGQNPDGRVPHRAAFEAPENGLQTPAVNRPAPDQDDTAPLLAVGGLPERQAASEPVPPRGARLRPHLPGAGKSRPRRMRGLLVTPWFAAGAGFVIAAALALNAPHTVLTYRPNTVPCASNCTTTGPGKGPAALGSPGVQIKTASPAPSARGPHRRRGHGHAGPVRHRGDGAGAPAGTRVGFRVIWHRYGQFSAVITIPARQAGRGWSLQFRIPGTQITQIQGAQWQPSGSDGGLATMLARPPRHGWGPGGSGGRGHGGQGSDGGRAGWRHGRGHHGRWPAGSAEFLVVGRGQPVTPVGCVLDHAACHFG